MKRYHFKYLLALLLSLFVLSACNNNNEEAPVRNFYTALSAGDIDKAVAQLDLSRVPENDRTMATDKFRLLLNEAKSRQIDAHGGISSIDITDKQTASDGNSVRMTVTINYGDGTKKTESVTVVKVNGEWKLQIRN